MGAPKKAQRPPGGPQESHEKVPKGVPMNPGSNSTARSPKRYLQVPFWGPLGTSKTAPESPRKAPGEPQEGSKRGPGEPLVQVNGVEVEAITFSALWGASWSTQDDPRRPHESPLKAARGLREGSINYPRLLSHTGYPASLMHDGPFLLESPLMHERTAVATSPPH